MTPQPERRQPAIVSWLKDYWHVGAGLIFLVLALGETRWQVAELIRDRDVDARQTANIRNNIVEIAEHDIEIQQMQLHMGPTAIQEYGALKSTVRRLERYHE